ncbi:hypothetical protein QAD02_019515 [Eretmocerus hayati]|uniref:Uncharacterized protein n=1 Tax=Eretmocerus hayati TaxID=131215 RepID=A0ACC2PJS9_9HYME|nr:hypothetical protein QAD02_019515 [Eretmocerus hayati]
MNHTDFFKWVDGHSIAELTNLKINDPKPLLSNMVLVTATRGSLKLQYKTAFDSVTHELDFLKEKVAKDVSKKPEALQKPLGVDKLVKESMLKNFISLVPLHRQSFWRNLPVKEPKKADAGPSAANPTAIESNTMVTGGLVRKPVRKNPKKPSKRGSKKSNNQPKATEVQPKQIRGTSKNPRKSTRAVKK